MSEVTRRGALVGAVALWGAGCAGIAGSGGGSVGDPGGRAHPLDPSWDDGLAVVSTFRGAVRRYGHWREAEARDYLVREYLDPADGTKRDRPSGGEVAVLKANRILEFDTGSYGYRLMGSFHFARADGALVQAVGTCINACGIVHQSYEGRRGLFRSESYWEGEGRAETALPLGPWAFADALPFAARDFEDGTEILVRAPLAAPRSTLVPKAAVGAALGIGIGDLCADCARPGGGSSGAAWAVRDTVPGRLLTVRRVDRDVFFVGSDGVEEARFSYDDAGFLSAFSVREEQRMERVRIYRGSYWQETHPDDRRRVAAV